MPFLGPCAASKFAIEGFASALRDEMKILNKLSGTNIQIGIIESGSYATGFNMETGNKKYVKAVETKRLKFRCFAPLHQAFFLQLLRIMGN